MYWKKNKFRINGTLIRALYVILVQYDVKMEKGILRKILYSQFLPPELKYNIIVHHLKTEI